MMEPKFGRLPKDEAYCASLPQMADFSPSLPDPQSYWSTTDLVAQMTGKTIAELYPIDGNDSFGDCTVAGAAHFITIATAFAGSAVIPQAKDVIDLYWSLGNGGDNGLPLATVLKAWQRGILGGNKIDASCNVNVDAADLKQVKQAVQFLGGAYIGFATTSDTVPQWQAGKPWTVTNARQKGGHCVVVTGFRKDGMWEILTWGGLQLATTEWFLKYVDEVHAVVTPSLSAFDSTTVADIKLRMPSLR